MDKVILMKVTSRSRPQILLDTVKSYIEKASDTKNMVWLFSFDVDDKTVNSDLHNGLLSLIEPLGTGAKSMSVTGTSNSKIHAINRDVNDFVPDWHILLNISDDQRPIVNGYDDIIRNTMPDHLDASLWFTDGQPRVNTQEIVGKSYYDRFKYIYHPDFKSLWCDNLATDMAAYLGKQIKSNKQIVKHFHPSWAGADSFKRDELYDRNDKFWNEDEATYKRLISQGLDKLVNNG